MCIAGISPQLKVAFYAGRYDSLLLGIFPVGNPMDCIAASSTDLVILEEPEHLAWFHCHAQWTSQFKHVVRCWLASKSRLWDYWNGGSGNLDRLCAGDGSQNC